MRESCVALRVALSDLEANLCERLSNDAEAAGIACSLLAEGAACVDELIEALSARMNEDVDARERLALEAIARRSGSTLDAVLFLVNLLGAAADPRKTPLEMRDVLRGLAGAPPRSDARRVSVVVNVAADLQGSGSFVGDARLASGLVLLAVAAAVHAGATSPHITVDAPSVSALRVRVAAGAPSSHHAAAGVITETLSLPIHDHVPHDPSVARVVARLCGVELVQLATSEAQPESVLRLKRA